MSKLKAHLNRKLRLQDSDQFRIPGSTIVTQSESGSKENCVPQVEHRRRCLKAACALHFAYYNFCRAHQTLRVTPAMDAGITDHVWSLEEMCATLPAQASAAKRIDKGLILKALGDKAS